MAAKWTLDQMCDHFVRRADDDLSAALLLIARIRRYKPIKICITFLHRSWQAVPVRGYVSAIEESVDFDTIGILFVMLRLRILLEYRRDKGLPAFDWDFETMMTSMVSSISDAMRRSFESDAGAWKTERFRRMFYMFHKLSADLNIFGTDIVTECIVPVAIAAADIHVLDDALVMLAMSTSSHGSVPRVSETTKEILMSRRTGFTTRESVYNLAQRLLFVGGSISLTIFSTIFDMNQRNYGVLIDLAYMIVAIGDFPAHVDIIWSMVCPYQRYCMISIVIANDRRACARSLARLVRSDVMRSGYVMAGNQLPVPNTAAWIYFAIAFGEDPATFVVTYREKIERDGVDVRQVMHVVNHTA